MTWRSDLWTYVIVTIVAILIWVWAAGETQEERAINYARVEFTVPDAESWVITPKQQALALVIEGPRLAIQEAETVLRKPLQLTLPAVDDQTQEIDILERLRTHEGLSGTGIKLTAAEPAVVEVAMDQMVQANATLKTVLPPGTKTDGDVNVEPLDVTVSMPGNLRSRLPAQLTVEAAIDRAELDRLEPGIRHTIEVKIRPPEGLTSSNLITITPPRAQVSFTLRSRVRETTLQNVPIRLANPIEDIDLYTVEIDPKQLPSVIISADEEIVRRIESGEVPVVAVLHVSTREKEERIKSKAVSYFLALVPQANGTTGYTPVNGRVGMRGEMPRIRLKISDK